MDLANFPREILTIILSLDNLTRQEIKSVRSTCRELCGVVTPILFHRIQISSLIQDLDAFFNIAKCPRLACNVRVIVWNELNGNLSTFDPSGLPAIGNSDRPFFEDLIANVESLFWIKFPDFDITNPATYEFPEIPALSKMIQAFQDEVISMPNLHTLVSKPMDPRRRLKIPSFDYPIAVDTIRTFINGGEIKCRYNFGFTNFLVPALKALAKAPQSKVTRLLYADEGVMTRTALSRLKFEDSEAFSTLQHLDLCIGGNIVEPLPLEGFLACLGNAHNLTNLHLCQEAIWADYSVPFTDLLSIIPTLPCLTELHLKDILPASAPTRFIARHAATLKRVTVISVDSQEEEEEQEGEEEEAFTLDHAGPAIWGDEETNLEEFAIDREASDDDNEDLASDVDMRPFYTQSDDAQELRAENAPRWDWGRDQDGWVWYWQVSDGSGHATEMWYFEHNGEHAYGQEPLEFWVDWDDGPEDKAEPTPYGWGLLHFFLQKGEVGSRIPFEEGKHERIKVYETPHDPMFSREEDWWQFLPVPSDFKESRKKMTEWFDIFDDCADGSLADHLREMSGDGSRVRSRQSIPTTPSLNNW